VRAPAPPASASHPTARGLSRWPLPGQHPSDPGRRSPPSSPSRGRCAVTPLGVWRRTFSAACTGRRTGPPTVRG
jgi:hypothetical protein